MPEVRGLSFQLQCPQEKKTVEAASNLGKLGPFDLVLSREEKDYQLLVSEKLKAVAKWDFHDSKQFSIE